MQLVTTSESMYVELVSAGFSVLYPNQFEPDKHGTEQLVCVLEGELEVGEYIDNLGAGPSRDQLYFLYPEQYGSDLDELLGLHQLEIEANATSYWQALYPSMDRIRIRAQDTLRIPCGVEGFEDTIAYAPKEVITLSGGYGTGKSTWGVLAAIDAAQRATSGVLGAFLEDMPVNVQAMIATYCNSRYDDEEERLEAINELLPRFKVLERNNFRFGAMTVENFLRHALIVHERFGTQFFIIDPWSALVHASGARGARSETEYIAEMLNAVQDFARKTSSIVMIVSHIPKGRLSNDGKPLRMTSADAMGSVHFANLSDRTLVFQTTNYWNDQAGHDRPHTIIHQDKVKVRHPLTALDGTIIPSMGRVGPHVFEYCPEELRYTEVRSLTREAINLWAGMDLRPAEDVLKEPMTGDFKRDVLNRGGNSSNSNLF